MDLESRVRNLRARNQELEKQQRPLELEVTRLKADIENHADELKLVSLQTLIGFCLHARSLHSSNNNPLRNGDCCTAVSCLMRQPILAAAVAFSATLS